MGASRPMGYMAALLALCLSTPLCAQKKPEREGELPPKVENSIGLELRLIPAGKFLMGSPDNEPGRQQREAQRAVVITSNFYIGAYEVTQAQYTVVMGKNPSRFGREKREKDPSKGKRFDSHPVDSVTWHGAVAFCEKLAELESEKGAGRRYRLPTEAEWEYACRAGNKGLWSFGNDRTKLAEHAWFRNRDSDLAAKPVGERAPNSWHLFDTHGNVWEWCQDWYAEEYAETSPENDPRGPEKGLSKVIRGGSYLSVPAHTRCATRFHDPPQIGDEDVGFRVVMTLEAHEKARRSK